MSGSASAAACTLASDADTAGNDLVQLGSATSVAQYQSIALSGTLQHDLNQVQSDYQTLLTDIGAS